MSDVIPSIAPTDVRLCAAWAVHKFSIVAATLPPVGGQPEVHRIETTEKAIRRFVDRLGGPDGLAVAYEAGPGGYDLFRLLAGTDKKSVRITDAPRKLPEEPDPRDPARRPQPTRLDGMGWRLRRP